MCSISQEIHCGLTISNAKETNIIGGRVMALNFDLSV